jgi:hypothetical protein
VSYLEFVSVLICWRPLAGNYQPGGKAQDRRPQRNPNGFCLARIGEADERQNEVDNDAAEQRPFQNGPTHCPFPMGRLSWRPLSYQAERALSPVGT